MILFKALIRLNKFSKYVPPQQDIPTLLAKFTTSRKDNFQILEQIAKQYNPHSHRHLITPDKKKILLKEFERYKDGKGYFDKIATIGWVIKELGMERECKGLLSQFVERVENDEWYVNFDESIRAIETFFDLAPSKKSKLYEKIERNIALTLWENNQIYYQKITNALVKAERYDSLLWQTVEHYCLNNLSMEYHPLTAINILLNFGKANQGSVMFYDSMMRLFYKGGHLFEANPLLTQVHHSYESSSVSAVIEAFGRASLKYKQLVILPEFRDYVYRLIFNNQFHLQELSHISSILRYVKPLGFDEQQLLLINSKVLSQLSEIQRLGDVTEIIEFHNAMADIGMELPGIIQQFIQFLFIQSLDQGRTNPKKYLRVYQYLKDNKLHENTEKLQLEIVNWVNRNSSGFCAEDLREVMSWSKREKLEIQAKGGKLRVEVRAEPPKSIE